MDPLVTPTKVDVIKEVVMRDPREVIEESAMLPQIKKQKNAWRNILFHYLHFNNRIKASWYLIPFKISDLRANPHQYLNANHLDWNRYYLTLKAAMNDFTVNPDLSFCLFELRLYLIAGMKTSTTIFLLLFPINKIEKTFGAFIVDLRSLKWHLSKTEEVRVNDQNIMQVFIENLGTMTENTNIHFDAGIIFNFLSGSDETSSIVHRLNFFFLMRTIFILETKLHTKSEKEQVKLFDTIAPPEMTLGKMNAYVNALWKATVDNPNIIIRSAYRKDAERLSPKMTHGMIWDPIVRVEADLGPVTPSTSPSPYEIPDTEEFIRERKRLQQEAKNKFKPINLFGDEEEEARISSSEREEEEEEEELGSEGYPQTPIHERRILL